MGEFQLSPPLAKTATIRIPKMRKRPGNKKGRHSVSGENALWRQKEIFFYLSEMQPHFEDPNSKMHQKTFTIGLHLMEHEA